MGACNRPTPLSKSVDSFTTSFVLLELGTIAMTSVFSTRTLLADRILIPLSELWAPVPIPFMSRPSRVT